jgi:hypothetical protein
MSKQQRSDQLKKFASYKYIYRTERSIVVAILYKTEGQDQRAEYSIKSEQRIFFIHKHIAERNMIVMIVESI